MKLKVEDSNRFGAISPSKLVAFERNLGVTLPDRYRKFLILHNGGCVAGARRIGELHHVFGLHDGPEWAQFAERAQNYGGFVPERLLPIADDAGGNLICISLHGPDRGVVYFWNHERGSDELRSLTLLAPDFASYNRGVAWKVALSRKRVGLIRRALDKGLAVNSAVYAGETLLDMAFERGSLRIVKMLVRAGGTIHPAVLIEAVRNAAPNTVQYLLDQGIPVNYAMSDTGFTSLMMAASGGNLEIARLLIARGADRAMKNTWGKTARDLAHKADLQELLDAAK